LDRASAPETFHCGAHERNSRAEISHDEPSWHALHVISKPREIPIAPRIRSALPSVDATIHFHDQPQRGREEICDVPATEHHLPAKRNT